MYKLNVQTMGTTLITHSLYIKKYTYAALVETYIKIYLCLLRISSTSTLASQIRRNYDMFILSLS